ncbi:MAG TPA: lytic transglycosylase domain-containing protein [Longimicrobiales bacterium]|nr:lytic transglycosylase domain-containing protein [Longimicrobiales bacterium]
MESIDRVHRSTSRSGVPRTEWGQTWRFTVGLPLLLAPAFLVSGDIGSGSNPDLQELVLPAQTLAVALPLHENARVDRWVKHFRTDQRAAFQRLLERQGAYDAIIRGKLRDRGMPEELLYLAMMESGLSPRAESSASAVGLWQFMTPTAQQYGLRVDEWVDERRDPVRATNAALDYLAYLHDRYGSWYLAAAAYNAGPGTVDRVLARHADGRSGDEDLYWEVLDYLPRETRDYVPRLVAAALLAEDVHGEGFDVQSERPYLYDRVFVPGGTSLATVAWRLHVTPRVLRNLNPHLIQGVTPPDETYPIRVPVGLSPDVVASVGRYGRLRRADD